MPTFLIGIFVLFSVGAQATTDCGDLATSFPPTRASVSLAEAEEPEVLLADLDIALNILRTC